MRITTAFIVCLSLAVAACGGGGTGSDGAAEDGGAVIQIDGSSTVYPVTEAMAEEYRNIHSAARITVGISGTGGGFQKFCRNEIDIADASRPISATEREACAAAGVEYIELPVAYDGLAVVVNPANTFATEMTVAELRKLWEPAAQGTVMRWNQIRPTWPDQEIHLFGAGVDSGTFDYFTEVIMGKSGASRGDYTSSEDDNVIVQGVSGDQYALGYFGFAYYEENRERLKLVAVNDGDDTNGAGAIAPSPETVANGTYRPLSRPIFIYPKLSALSRPEVESFIQFYLNDGVPLVRDVGYIPLTDSEYDQVRQRFASRRTGTMYEGGTQAGVTLSERLSR